MYYIINGPICVNVMLPNTARGEKMVRKTEHSLLQFVILQSLVSIYQWYIRKIITAQKQTYVVN